MTKNRIELTQYTHLSIEKIPQNWTKKKISDCFNVVTGTTPSTSCLSYWQSGDIDWITPDDLGKNNDCIYIDNCERKITSSAVDKCSLRLLPGYSLIVSTRAPVGYVAINRKIATINQGCKGLIAKHKNRESVEFFRYFLRYHKKELERLSAGSTFKELSKTSLASFTILYPPIQEQHKIADILSTVDVAISETDAIIAQTERLRRGLTQELFTKGIGNVKFKMTEIGLIPVEWEIKQLYDLCNLIQDGTHYPPQRVESGYPLLGVTNMINGRLLRLSSDTFISKNDFDILEKKFSLKENDIVLATVGATMGKVAIVERMEPFQIQRSVAVIRPKPELLDYNFLKYYMGSNPFQKTLWRLAGYSAQAGIYLKTISGIKIPLPSLVEQIKIAEILLVFDLYLISERLYRQRLEELKKGLMQDLLTGRVQVKTAIGVNDNA